jgi:hypothetical protein
MVNNFKKAVSVAKIGMKYYISFHLIPLLLRLRKCKDFNQAVKLLSKAAMEYVRSVLFMVFLVAGMKCGQCMAIKTGYPWRGKSLLT